MTRQKDGNGGGRKVLVVEDDPSIREALSDVLSLAGHVVATAEHGRAALEEIERGGVPDVILLDLRMPVMSGVEFLRAVTPRRLACRVIVLTANPRDLPTNVDVPFLAKPYDVNRLLRIIEG